MDLSLSQSTIGYTSVLKFIVVVCLLCLFFALKQTSKLRIIISWLWIFALSFWLLVDGINAVIKDEYVKLKGSFVSGYFFVIFGLILLSSGFFVVWKQLSNYKNQDQSKEPGAETKDN